MAAIVTVVAGPARSGKTERLLARYRKVLAERTACQVLWIAPTARSVSALRDRLLNESLRACLEPRVVTFDGFAEMVLEAAAEPIEPVSPQLKRQLLAGLVERARQAGSLEYFAGIVGSEGLVDLVDQFISELKRREIWPEQFVEVASQRGLDAKDREFAAFYAEYQEVLTAKGLYDREGRFWSARRLLRDGQPQPFEWLRLVVVDGFTDFSRTQHEILEILAQRVQEILVSLPAELESGREHLFAKASATCRILRERHAQVQVETLPRRAPVDWPAMDHLERQLFKGPQDALPAPSTERIEIVAASQQLGEIELLARRIKQFIVERQAVPDDIAVVFRSLTDVAPLVEEVFGELGVPIALESGRALQEARSMRALVSLLRLHVEDWPFRRLLAVLGSNYFAPDWPEWHKAQAPAATERVVRRLQVPSGQEALLARVQWLVEQAGEGDAKSALLDDARRALPVLRRLRGVLAALPLEASPSEWAQALSALAQVTGLNAAIEMPPEWLSAGEENLEHTAWRALLAALTSAERVSHWLDEDSQRLTIKQLLTMLSGITRGESVARAGDDCGRVRILSASGARSLEIGTLFLAGLSERSFPAPARDDRLYSDAELHHLKAAGLPLVDRTERHQEEMLLFYEALTRARDRLVLSFPALDDRAQPLSPSSFLLEVERAMGHGVLPRQVVADLSPVPATQARQSARDLRVDAVASLTTGDRWPLSRWLANPSAGPVAPNLLAALSAMLERRHGESFGPLEGMVSSLAAVGRLATQFGPEHPWSPTRLEQYAYCPHQFFLAQVLRLRPLEELALEIDYMARGSLLHEVLAVVHRRLNDESGRPVLPAHVGQSRFLALVDEALDEAIAASTPARGLEAAFREIDRRLLLEWAEKYYQQHEQYDAQWQDLDEPFRPTHFEVRFGPRRATDGGLEDPLSRDEAYALDLEGESLRLVGRIDRVDVGSLAGQPIFNLIDYKSGAAQRMSRADIEAGTALQLPLYALAAQSLLADRQAAPWQAGYWFVRADGFSARRGLTMSRRLADLVQTDDDWQRLVDQVRQRVKQLVHGIRQGAFPMVSVDDHCTGRCPFHTVCRVNQVRALDKTWDLESID